MRWRPILQGARSGAFAWMAYAVCECTVLTLLPWMLAEPWSYRPVHWGLSCALFAAYPVIGAVLGGALAAVLVAFRSVSDSSAALRAVAGLGLVSCFAANVLASGSPPFSTLVMVGVNGLLAGALGIVITGRWASRLERVADPWPLAVVLVGSSWLLGHDGKLFLAAAAAAPVVLVAAALPRRSGTGPASGPGPGSTVVLAASVLAASAVLAPAPYEREPLDVARPPEGTPNVILITLDTVRADHLSLHGYERRTSPHLDTFASESMVCSLALAPSDMTLSTHASLFTGLPASLHGAHYAPDAPGGRPLSAEFETLAERLSAAGFQSAAVVANHAYLSRYFGLDQGFEYYDQRSPAVLVGSVPPFLLRSAARAVLLRLAPEVDRREYRDAASIGRDLVPVLARLVVDPRPFFLFVNYMDAHAPYQPPPPWDRIFPGRTDGLHAGALEALEGPVLRLERTLSENERRHLVSQYDGEIAYLDHHLGRLFQRLGDLGLLESSLVVVTSDHGEAFGERDLLGHGVSVYQDQIGVPLIVRFPGAAPHGRIQAPCSLLDIRPTILAAVGLAEAAGPGADLRTLEASPRALISESFPNGYLLRWHPRFRRVERSILQWPFKLILSTVGKREVYDLSADPAEVRDLFERGGSFEAMATELERWIAMAEVPAPGESLDPAVTERLRALGYVR